MDYINDKVIFTENKAVNVINKANLINTYLSSRQYNLPVDCLFKLELTTEQVGNKPNEKYRPISITIDFEFVQGGMKQKYTQYLELKNIEYGEYCVIMEHKTPIKFYIAPINEPLTSKEYKIVFINYEEFNFEYRINDPYMRQHINSLFPHDKLFKELEEYAKRCFEMQKERYCCIKPILKSSFVNDGGIFKCNINNLMNWTDWAGRKRQDYFNYLGIHFRAPKTLNYNVHSITLYYELKGDLNSPFVNANCTTNDRICKYDTFKLLYNDFIISVHSSGFLMKNDNVHVPINLWEKTEPFMNDTVSKNIAGGTGNEGSLWIDKMFLCNDMNLEF